MTLSEQAEDFSRRVNLIAALDHSGRAGNGFFLTLFDQHPEVLTCAWMHYSYSYILTDLKGFKDIDSAYAREVWTKKSYFRFVYNDLDENLSAQMIAFGGDPTAVIDRPKVREIFDALILAKPKITSKDLILATYFAFGIGSGRDLSRIKYIMVSDAVSLRFEWPLQGFSGQIAAAMREDFPDIRLAALVRDPRATFTSCRHQFVNSNGNMYGLKPWNAWRKLKDLSRARLTPDDCAYLYWILYFAATARTVFRLWRENPSHLRFFRNEDLNLDFKPSIAEVCRWLEVGWSIQWDADNYTPTIVGRPWRGTGAFNNRYQRNLHGPLKNDDEKIADTVTGPNAYVTQRWRSRLSDREITILDYLFADEMRVFGYSPRAPVDSISKFSLAIKVLLPYRGELPRLDWIWAGRYAGLREIGLRIFYACAFFPYYLVSRVVLLRLVFRVKFFGLPTGADQAFEAKTKLN